MVAILGLVYYVLQSELESFNCRKVEREAFRGLHKLVERTRDDSIMTNRTLSLEVISGFSGSLRLVLSDFGPRSCGSDDVFGTTIESVTLSAGQTRGLFFFQNPDFTICYDRDGLESPSFPIDVQTSLLCSGREYKVSFSSSFSLPTWSVKSTSGNWIDVDFR